MAVVKTSYVFAGQSVVQTETWKPRSFSPRLSPPLPGGNECSGSLVPYGSCSASHRLKHTEEDVHSGDQDFMLSIVLTDFFTLFFTFPKLKNPSKQSRYKETSVIKSQQNGDT